ncbi:hypothetical protein V6N11_075282 [Hibiscus sabdariffa]|uniref:Uncharacterized protein n=1 Tax=Hibiscus sabdariffa TaxID=183260 RepID=A0ABR2R640_9ROSI
MVTRNQSEERKSKKKGPENTRRSSFEAGTTVIEKNDSDSAMGEEIVANEGIKCNRKSWWRWDSGEVFSKGFCHHRLGFTKAWVLFHLFRLRVDGAR